MTRETAEQELARELEPGERLLRSGVPPQGLILRGGDVFLIPFSLMWGGFAIFWETSVLRSNASSFMVLWGIPFVLIGLYFIVGRFFVEAQQRARMSYGLTERRIIIKSGIFSKNVKSLALETLTDLALSEKPDGRGTITFGPLNTGLGYGQTPWPGMPSYTTPCFELIPQAKDVYSKIREVQRRA